MLISFSGIDGAGKSSLATWLEAELERQRRPVTVLHFNDDIGVYSYLRALRDWLTRRTRTKYPPRYERRAKLLGRIRDAVLWSKTLRRLLYPLDVLILLCYRAYVEKLRRRVLIMDRYLYDRLVDVAGPGAPRWLQAVTRLTPKPDLPILLVITPEEAYARKGEYNVEYLRQRESNYRRVFKLVRGSIWLHAHELESAKRTIAGTVRDRLRP